MSSHPTDATPVKADKSAGDSSASASSNLFADFLKSRPEDFQAKGSTAQQVMSNVDDTIAGGKSAFKALPEMKPPENASASDKSFNFAAAMKQNNGSNADQALDNTLRNVA